jgi:DNA-binding MarR family transcriptional regulator
LQQEIKQSTPFETVKQELWLNMARTAAVLEHHFDQRLRPFGLSLTQYNVLRILRGAQRGASPEGLGQSEIRDRLVAPVPDVPRILERMEKAGWITRMRGETDRRTTIATISKLGLETLATTDPMVEEMVEGSFQEVPVGELERFSELLTMARCLGKGSCEE